MLKRIPTGWQALDSALEGGIPEGVNILLIGPPGSGKTIFALHLISNIVRREENCAAIIVNIDYPVSDIERVSEKLGLGLHELFDKKIFFVEGYEWRLGEVSGNAISNISNLNEIIIKIENVKNNIKSKGLLPKILFIDSLTTLIMYNDYELVFRMLQIITARTKGERMIGLYTIEAGVHVDKVAATMNYISDAIFRFEKKEDKFALIIERMRATGVRDTELYFSIEDGKGVVL